MNVLGNGLTAAEHHEDALSVNEAVFHPTEPIIGSCGSDRKIFLGELDI